MPRLYSLAKLENIDVKEDKALLETINSKTNNLQLEFCMQLCDIVDLFKYYINKNAEHIEDINNYDCIDIDIIKENNDILFTLNPSDDEEDISDIKFLDKEFKRYFGSSILKCDIKKVLRILLTDCKEYSIDNETLKLNMYYDNYKHTWLGEYLSNLNSEI